MFWALLSKCPEAAHAFGRIDISKLELQASSLRNGIQSVVTPGTCALGGVNIVLELKFDDGVIWVAGIRQRTCPAEASQNSRKSGKTIESEVATMQFLKSNTSLPVPAVYGYDVRYDNKIGGPYIFMEAMPGKRLLGGGRADFIPEEHKAKVYAKIADILIELFSLKFPKKSGCCIAIL
jgi:hypothetical protein